MGCKGSRVQISASRPTFSATPDPTVSTVVATLIHSMSLARFRRCATGGIRVRYISRQRHGNKPKEEGVRARPNFASLLLVTVLVQVGCGGDEPWPNISPSAYAD